MVGRPHSQVNGWGGVVVDAPSCLLSWRECPVHPAVGERERLVSRVGVEGGVTEDMDGGGVAFLWAGSCAAGRTSSCLALAFPATLDTTRDRAAFSGSSPSR